MDRDTAITVAITTIVLTLIGGWYLSPSASPQPAEGATAHAEFSSDDVRYKYQQDEEKWAKKHKGQKPPAFESSGGSDTNPETSENEAPPIDDSSSDGGTNEEPPIE